MAKPSCQRRGKRERERERNKWIKWWWRRGARCPVAQATAVRDEDD